MGFIRRKFELLVRSVISEHFPDLAGRVHVSGQGVQPRGFSESGYEVFNQSVWVHKAATVWENHFSPLPLLVWDDQEKREAQRHDRLKAVLATPNDDTTACDFWGRMIQDIALQGEHFVEVSFDSAGRLLQFNQIPPNYVSVVVGTKGKERLWEMISGYHVNAAFPLSQVKLDYMLAPDKMIFFRNRNPEIAFAPRGISQIGSLRQPILTDLHGREWNLGFMKNAARPDVIAIVPQGVSPKEKKKIEDDISVRFTASSGGTGRVLVLEQGLVDFKDWTSSQKDIQWQELLKLTREEIGASFGLPPEFMGFGNSTFDNMDRAELLVWTGTIIPLTKQRDDRLTHFLRMIGELSHRFSIKTDLSGVEGLRRLFNTSYRQAQALFSMGVPFDRLNDKFGFDVRSFPGDDISAPLSQQVGLGKDGDSIDNSPPLKVSNTSPKDSSEAGNE